MPIPTVTRIVLVDVAASLASALHSALARIGGQVVAGVTGEQGVAHARRARPDLILVGQMGDARRMRVRCRALRTRIAAPIVALVDDGELGVELCTEPAIDDTLMIRVGIDAVVSQLPIVLSRWRAWARPTVVGPLRVDRTQHAVELWGVEVPVSERASRTLAAYADRRREQRRSGPLPRVEAAETAEAERAPSLESELRSRRSTTGPLPALERITGPLPTLGRITGPLARIARAAPPRPRRSRRTGPVAPIDTDDGSTDDDRAPSVRAVRR